MPLFNIMSYDEAKKRCRIIIHKLINVCLHFTFEHKLAIRENISPVGLAQYGLVYSLGLGSIRTRIKPAHEANTRKYWLVEVFENEAGCTMKYCLGKSLELRQYFIVYPSSHHNTVTILYWPPSVQSEIVLR